MPFGIGGPPLTVIGVGIPGGGPPMDGIPPNRAAGMG